ncbi:MAG: hypothetical protein R3B70_05755 [Polyangiaceae bacterium]
MDPTPLQEIPLPLLVRLAREHFADDTDVKIDPDISRSVLRNVHAAHAIHVAPADPIALVYDGTLFGGGDLGFIATPTRFCWRTSLAHPRTLAWEELAGLPIEPNASRVAVGAGHIEGPWFSSTARRLAGFLRACAGQVDTGVPSYRRPARTVQPATFADVVRQIARRTLGEHAWVHYAPSIPPRMERNVRIVHARRLAGDDRLLVVYDNTVFGSASDGFVLTERALHLRNFWGAAVAFAWPDLEPDISITDSGFLALEARPPRTTKVTLDVRTHPELIRDVASALSEIARAARGACARADTETILGARR